MPILIKIYAKKTGHTVDKNVVEFFPLFDGRVCKARNIVRLLGEIRELKLGQTYVWEHSGPVLPRIHKLRERSLK